MPGVILRKSKITCMVLSELSEASDDGMSKEFELRSYG